MSYLIILLYFLICISVAFDTMVEVLFLIKKSKVEFPDRITASFPALPPPVLIHPSLLILHSSLAELSHKVSGISSISVIIKHAQFPGTSLWSASLHPSFFIKAAQNQMIKTKIVSPQILALIYIYSLLRESLFSPISGHTIETPDLSFPSFIVNLSVSPMAHIMVTLGERHQRHPVLPIFTWGRSSLFT